MRVIKNCKTCHVLFNDCSPNKFRKWCSNRCKMDHKNIKYRITQIEINKKCKTCNVDFIDKTNRKHQMYCNVKCYKKSTLKNSIFLTKNCKECKNEFNDYTWGKNKVFCSIACKKNTNFRLKHNLRSRLNKAIRNNQKQGSAIKDLGCSIPELKQHLKAKFQPNMSWNNYSHKGWHVDHIKPLASFDLSSREEFLKACHYTNLQPLWAKDNMKKGSKYE